MVYTPYSITDITLRTCPQCLSDEHDYNFETQTCVKCAMTAQPRKRKRTMLNYSTAIFLDEDSGVRAIAVTYDKIDLDKDTSKMKWTAPYLSGGSLPKDCRLHKTCETSIKVGDFVVVPSKTRHGFTVCKVVAVDCEVDHEAEGDCHWIAPVGNGGVNVEEFEHLRQQEDIIITAIKKGEAKKKRKKMAKSFKKGMDGDLPKMIAFGAKTEPASPVGSARPAPAVKSGPPVRPGTPPTGN